MPGGSTFRGRISKVSSRAIHPRPEARALLSHGRNLVVARITVYTPIYTYTQQRRRMRDDDQRVCIKRTRQNFGAEHSHHARSRPSAIVVAVTTGDLIVDVVAEAATDTVAVEIAVYLRTILMRARATTKDHSTTTKSNGRRYTTTRITTTGYYNVIMYICTHVESRAAA